MVVTPTLELKSSFYHVEQLECSLLQVAMVTSSPPHLKVMTPTQILHAATCTTPRALLNVAAEIIAFASEAWTNVTETNLRSFVSLSIKAKLR